MLIRIWILLLAVAFTTSTIAAPDLSADRVEIVEIVETAFEDAVTATETPSPAPMTSPIGEVASDDTPPGSPTPSTVWRPPRLPS